jgi:hypothetical protein
VNHLHIQKGMKSAPATVDGLMQLLPSTDIEENNREPRAKDISQKKIDEVKY